MNSEKSRDEIIEFLEKHLNKMTSDLEIEEEKIIQNKEKSTKKEKKTVTKRKAYNDMSSDFEMEEKRNKTKKN